MKTMRQYLMARKARVDGLFCFCFVGFFLFVGHGWRPPALILLLYMYVVFYINLAEIEY